MPLVPNIANGIVPPAKITHYLLDEAHPVGGAKARFFASFGFDSEHPEILADALLRHAQGYDFASLQMAPHGAKYEIKGRIATPDGSNPVVRAVWIIDHGKAVPRFVTAVPDRE